MTRQRAPELVARDEARTMLPEMARKMRVQAAAGGITQLILDAPVLNEIAAAIENRTSALNNSAKIERLTRRAEIAERSERTFRCLFLAALGFIAVLAVAVLVAT